MLSHQRDAAYGTIMPRKDQPNYIFLILFWHAQKQYIPKGILLLGLESSSLGDIKYMETFDLQQFYFTLIKLLVLQQMFQKENTDHRSRRDRKGISSKLTGEANDYVLKRYKLQQNQLFKDRQNEQVRYDAALKKEGKVEEEIEDDLVIIPLELDTPQELEVVKQAGEEQNQEIFVFDEDEEIEEETPNRATSSIQEEFKSTSRSNYSIAELLRPGLKQKTKFGVDPNYLLDKLCKEEPQEKKESSQQQGLKQLKGVKVGEQNPMKGVSITITDKKLFCISKLPSGIVLQCLIKRSSSIMNLMSPQYDLYLCNGLKHILSAKRYPLRNRELFKFSVDPLKFNEGNQLAIMHANTNHNIYWLLDRPRRLGEMDLSLIYLVVGYYKLKGQEGRRFSTLLPPTCNSEYQLAMDYQLPSINFSSMKKEVNTQLSNILQWSGKTNSSSKNCVIADENDPDYRFFQLKKESEDVFRLTVQHPYSPLQAMAIAMTRFDAQLK